MKRWDGPTLEAVKPEIALHDPCHRQFFVDACH